MDNNLFMKGISIELDETFFDETPDEELFYDLDGNEARSI